MSYCKKNLKYISSILYVYSDLVRKVRNWITQWWARILALKYFSYLCLRHIPSLNIFRYSFVDFWMTVNFWIFFCKFLKILVFLVFPLSLILIFACLCPSNIIHICICAISKVQINSNTLLVSMGRLNIFGYFFGKIFGICIYLDILFDISSSLG